MIFVSAETMAAYGDSEGILQYEAVMPNPVTGFAYRLVQDNFGLDEEAMMVVDNTERFSLSAMLGVIADFGTRSMQHMAIRYPYWENYARGYEDIVALILLFRVITLLIPAVLLVIILFKAYRRRTFTWLGLIKWLGAFIVTLATKLGKAYKGWTEKRRENKSKKIKKRLDDIIK
jgi:hypothetical protein